MYERILRSDLCDSGVLCWYLMLLRSKFRSFGRFPGSSVIQPQPAEQRRGTAHRHFSPSHFQDNVALWLVRFRLKAITYFRSKPTTIVLPHNACLMGQNCVEVVHQDVMIKLKTLVMEQQKRGHQKTQTNIERRASHILRKVGIMYLIIAPNAKICQMWLFVT